jgi:hypothetical protein
MLEQLIYGAISLSQLPVPLASFYYLGEATHIPEVLELRTKLAQAEADSERYYRAACRGGFGTPIIKPQGKTFRELEALRRVA